VLALTMRSSPPPTLHSAGRAIAPRSCPAGQPVRQRSLGVPGVLPTKPDRHKPTWIPITAYLHATVFVIAWWCLCRCYRNCTCGWTARRGGWA